MQPDGQAPWHPDRGESWGQALVEPKGCAWQWPAQDPRRPELTVRAQQWQLLPPGWEWTAKGGPGAGQAVPHRQGRATAVDPGEQGWVVTAAGLISSPVITGQKHRNKPGQQGLSVPQSPDTG